MIVVVIVIVMDVFGIALVFLFPKVRFSVSGLEAMRMEDEGDEVDRSE